MIKKIIVTFAFGTFIAAAVVTALVLQNSFPSKFMDLDDSGFVSPREAIQTLDMGVRNENIGGKDCVEIFALKDGLPIKQICPES